MPAIHECPSCDKKIKVPDEAEGRKIRCPGCQTTVLITEDGLERVKSNGVKAGSSARHRSADDEDEDDRPRSKRSSRDDVDEDDRPRKKKKKSSGGIPVWVWLASSGGLAAAIGLVLFLVLGGGGSKFNKVKKDMTDKEVMALVGEPHEGGAAFGQATWYYPKLSVNNPTTPKETLTVHFQNGKAIYLRVDKFDEIMKGFKGMGGF